MKRLLRFFKKWRIPILLSYIGLLVLSFGVRTCQAGELDPRNGTETIAVQAVNQGQQTGQSIRFAYRAYAPAVATDRLPIIILHGSPGTSQHMTRLAPVFASTHRVILPDLPGFGNSTRRIPDYSIRAHALYLLQLMDHLDIQRAHLVGYSMGGGVVLNMAEIAPQRVASLTMLAAIGVQELELLGDYHLNHMLHGLQLAGLTLLCEALPHMGVLDEAMLNVSYARNFFDSDQRPLRTILQHYAGPMLILHGTDDMLVPREAAYEHHRIVPQSELHLVDASHFVPFSNPQLLASPMRDFIERVEQGNATVRATANPQRKAQATEPFRPEKLPKVTGFAAGVVAFLFGVATLVSEDLASISAGVMASQGRIDFFLVAFACFLGIFIGDMLLFLAGRLLGRPALTVAPFKWFIKPQEIDRSSEWLTHKGLTVVAVSRVIPGARLPTYFAAGMLKTRAWSFAGYFLLAAAIWAPLLVGLAMVLGGEVLKTTMHSGQMIVLQGIVLILAIWMGAKLALQLATWQGRRRLIGAWRRLTRWEFWPIWVVYPPVVGYILWLALKHRSLTLFTAANPAIPGGGFVGESKIDILNRLRDSENFVARAALIPTTMPLTEKCAFATHWMEENSLGFPIVLKPDVGERGSGVEIVRSVEELQRSVQAAAGNTIMQEYIPGHEFGVFYYRYPGEETGHIFSITDKQFPRVTGDGKKTLEQLILRDERAVCLARWYCSKNQARLDTVPAEGEQIQLVEIGSHCRGAIFLDGERYHTPALQQAIDRISQRFDGFFFGRFDIRAPSLDDFQQGTRFTVIELNGVTSEATHIYDPRYRLSDAYRVLFAQWRIAFAIGAENRKRGIRPLSVGALLRLVWKNGPGGKETGKSMAHIGGELNEPHT